MPSNRYRNTCGKLIRGNRIKLAWTQDDLAAKLQLAGLSHIDRVSLAKIESNIRSVYDYELVIIADVFKISLEEIVPKAATVRANLQKLLPKKGS